MVLGGLNNRPANLDIFQRMRVWKESVQKQFKLEVSLCAKDTPSTKLPWAEKLKLHLKMSRWDFSKTAPHNRT